MHHPPHRKDHPPAGAYKQAMRHAFNIFTLAFFVGAAFVLFTSISDLPMQLSRLASSFTLSLSLGAGATAQGSNLNASIDAQWHKPAKFWDTDLDAAINATGTYGFIFNSSTLPAGVKYGSYNYCNMPHVRRPEYEIPSKEYQLEYVEIIHRHHKRTPYSSNLVDCPLKDLNRRMPNTNIHSSPKKILRMIVAIPSFSRMDQRMVSILSQRTGRLCGPVKILSPRSAKVQTANSHNSRKVASETRNSTAKTFLACTMTYYTFYPVSRTTRSDSV